MKERINQKIDELSDFLLELKEIVPPRLDDYLNNIIIKAACERYFEKIVEAVVDLAFLVIREKSLRTPEEDREAFDILCNAKIIDFSLAVRLKEAKGMRNFLAHQYGAIDNALVFRALKHELQKDARRFLEAIEKSMR